MSRSSPTKVMAPPVNRTVEARRSRYANNLRPDETRRRGSAPDASSPPRDPVGAEHSIGQINIHPGLPVRIQTRLIVGRPSDSYEEEADRAANLVTGISAPEQMPGMAAEPSAPLRRQPLETADKERRDEDDKSEIKRRQASAAPHDLPQTPPGLDGILSEAGAEGRPLPAGQRSFYEGRFGHDFGAVRVHAGPRSAAAAAAVGAKAFTRGSNVYFGAGHYQPETGAGRWLMAHELAHTIQQTGPHGANAPAILRKEEAPGAAPIDPLSVATRPTPAAGDLRPSPTDEAHQAPAPTDQTGQPGVDSKSAPQDGKAGEPGKTIWKPESKAGIEDKVKTIANTDQKAEAGAGAAAAGAKGETPPETEPSPLGGLPTGDLVSIDKELAEHQRWGAASAKVGAAGSAERAKFIADIAAGGSSFTAGLVKGAEMGAGIKIGEKIIEKGAVRIATKAATRLGSQVAKFTPLPAVGAVIGGVISAYELASRDWKATGETIGRFGQGASIYEQLANSIEAISTVLDVATQVLNIIAGVIGAISIAMWVITVLTVGIASPLAATLSTIAVGIGLATLILDAINALGLKQLVTLFRSLHTFTSDADPRDVVTQGKAIGQAAGAATGFVGGFAGGVAGGGLVEKGGKRLSSKKPSTPVPDHQTPPAASGDGPNVKAQPPVDAKSTVKAEPPVEAKNVAVDTTKPAVEKQPAVTGADIPHGQQKAPGLTSAPESQKGPAQQGATAQTTGGGSPAGSGGGGKGRGRAESGKLTSTELKKLADKPDLTPSDIKKLADHLGVSPDQARSLIIQAELAKTVQGSRGASKGGGLVGPEFQDIPGKQKPFLRPGEEMPGRTKYSSRQDKARIQASQRRIARERFGLKLQEALKDPSKGDKLTQLTESYLTEKQKAEVRRTGKLPDGFEFHHFLTIADFPELGHLPEVGAGLPKDVHKEAGHAMDTTRPLEAGTLLDPKAETRPPFQLDPLTQKGARRAPKEIAKGAQSSGRVDKDIAIQLRDELKTLREQAAKDPSPKLAKEIAARESFLQTLEPSSGNTPGSATPAATPSTSQTTGTPTSKVVEASPSSVPDTGSTSSAPTQMKTAVSPNTPESQPVPVSEPTPALKAPPSPQSDPALLPGKDLGSFSHLPPAARAGERAGEEKAEPESGLSRNISEFSKLSMDEMTTSEKIVYLAGGPATGAAAVTAMRGIEEASSEPVVEHVNPKYPDPPCTPQKIVDVQNQILETLDARAQAEAASAAMAKQEADHKANEKPLTNMKERNDEAISATDAHKQAVARRTDANKGKEKKEGEVSGALSDYSNRAAKLATITVPMRGFERFTSLAYSLPDSPDVLVGAKRGIIKMNTDSKRFLGQLDSMDQTINNQKASQGDRNKQIQSDANTLTQTDNNAKESTEGLNKAQQTTQELDSENQTRLEQATKLRTEADQNVATLDNQEQQKKAEAESLSSELQSWAQNHRQARLDALDETKKGLEQRGYKVTEVKDL